MKKICFINGSPRGKNGASQYFIEELDKLVDKSSFEVIQFILNNKVDYEEVSKADVLIFAFPLYVDSLPSGMIEFLVNLEQYAGSGKKSARVYAVVNCGFYEGVQNRHAVRIIKNFCAKAGYKWRFGMGIGAGEFMRETKDNIPMNSKVKRGIFEALKGIGSDIKEDSEAARESIFISPKFPRLLYILGGNMGWVKAGKLKSVSKQQLYARPYAEKE